MQEFYHARLPLNPTKEEIKLEIARLKAIQLLQRNADLSLKIIINSIYGVAGYVRFICYHREVAQSITKQSEDIIKYTEKIMNAYFRDIWPTDAETHEKMGLSQVIPVENDAVIYMDTDSTFLSLSKFHGNTDHKGTVQEFILELYDVKLKDYIKEKLYEYCDAFSASRIKTFNGVDSFLLEMEQIAYNIIWVAKKRYMKELAWYKNIDYDRLKKIEIIGLETKQSSMPKFFRDELKKMFLFMLKHNGNPDRQELADLCRQVNSKMQMLPIDEICKTERVSKYHNYVMKDTDTLEFASGTRAQVKAAGLYNHMLNNSEFKTRYPIIESGAKVKYYYIKNKRADVETFGFLPSSFPAEIAPEVDYDVQFDKLFLSPINNILKALKIDRLDTDLSVMPHYW